MRASAEKRTEARKWSRIDMIKIVAQNLHTPDKLPDEIVKSCDMLVSIAQSIRESVLSGNYNHAQGNLDRAVRELQYIDRMIDEAYGDLGTPENPLSKRVTPESNYLLNPQFHSPPPAP
jgi:hypothetical protein